MFLFKLVLGYHEFLEELQCSMVGPETVAWRKTLSADLNLSLRLSLTACSSVVQLSEVYQYPLTWLCRLAFCALVICFLQSVIRMWHLSVITNSKYKSSSCGCWEELMFFTVIEKIDVCSYLSKMTTNNLNNFSIEDFYYVTFSRPSVDLHRDDNLSQFHLPVLKFHIAE